MFEGCLDKVPEERMRGQRGGLKFRMELGSDKERVVANLDNFDKLIIG